jgi:ABC-type transport system involved in multi-copper enzyme maturation permease subunit
MIWLTWRQFRTQAWVAVAILAAAAAVLAATGPHVFDVYRGSGLAACPTDCGDLGDRFLAEAMGGLNGPIFYGGFLLLFVLPALIGVFWGAPLVARELEVGTHRLVWNQTVTRGRWLAVKLAGVGLSAAVFAGLIGLAVTWWSGPFDAAHGDRITPVVFAARGVVPFGYAAFAFVLGALAGLVTRRTLVAMAITIPLVAAVQVLMPVVVRPLLVTPVHATSAFQPGRIKQFHFLDHYRIQVSLQPPVSDAWAVDNRTVDAAGDNYTGPVDPTSCGPEASPADCEHWLTGLGLRQEIDYVPGDRFWALQWRELGVLLAATVLLSWGCLWWIRRRVA